MDFDKKEKEIDFWINSLKNTIKERDWCKEEIEHHKLRINISEAKIFFMQFNVYIKYDLVPLVIEEEYDADFAKIEKEMCP